MGRERTGGRQRYSDKAICLDCAAKVSRQRVGQASSLTVRAASLPPIPKWSTGRSEEGNTGQGCPENRQAGSRTHMRCSKIRSRLFVLLSRTLGALHEDPFAGSTPSAVDRCGRRCKLEHLSRRQGQQPLLDAETDHAAQRHEAGSRLDVPYRGSGHQ